MLQIVRQAERHATRTAFRSVGSSTTYAQLLRRSLRFAGALLDGRSDLAEERIAFMIAPGTLHAELQWGIWRAGGIAVPLNAAATARELTHVLQLAGVSRVVVDGAPQPALAEAAAAVSAHCLDQACFEFGELESMPDLDAERRAMIVFTSGTTALPKGAVWTHGMLDAQVRALVEAWEWEAEDCIPLFLPLHHVHGIVNVMSCALWSGACIEAFDGFRQEQVLERISEKAYSVFMAVPTIYVRLAQTLEAMSLSERLHYRDGLRRMRLMVSGSAALPASLHERWRKLTGQLLLERYGMTEIGMALSNPVRGERRPGSVGLPLPGVELRLVAEDGTVIEAENEPGELWVRGPGVFREYWGNPQATRDAFTDGWFRTGDMAVLERGYYRIMGRSSVDIIKSGGYKISALEIENVLLENPAIRECAVIGLDDETWGELVAVVAVAAEQASPTLEELAKWCEGKLSPYKLPRRLVLVPALPRNAMGKVLKPGLGELFR